METLHLQLLGHHHVVDPAAGLLGDVAVLVEEGVPTGMVAKGFGLLVTSDWMNTLPEPDDST